MNKRTRTMVVSGIVLALVIVAVGIVLLIRQERQPNTAAVERGALDVTIETIGRIIPREPTTVRAPVDGIVDVIAVSVGDAVQAGDVLVALDREPFERAVSEAERAVEDAEAALNLLEQQGEAATPDETAQRLAAQQRIDEARRALERARENLAAALITAPVNGTVVELPVETLGRLAAGTPIARLANLSDLELSIDLDEIDVPNVEVGTPTTFTLDAFPGQSIDGRISWVSPVAQTAGGTTTFPARIGFQTPDDLRLLPGMNADVAISIELRDGILLIPEQALRTVGRRTFVTVWRDGRTEEREIEVGLRSDGLVEVASGLAEGERVVIP